MPESTNPWVVRSGEPALPYDYRATVGYKPFSTPGATNDAWSQHFGQPAAVAVTSPPIYTQQMLDAMWGKGRGAVYDTKGLLYDLGYLPSKDAALGFWTNTSAGALQNAMADANKNGQSLENMRQTLLSGGKLAYGPGSGGSQTSVSTSNTSSSSDSTSISLTSREGAHAALSQQLANELGREPTNAELTRFLNSLNGTERANPSTSHQSGSSSSTTVSGPGGSSTTGSSSSHTSSVSRSTDPSAEAQHWARGQTDLAAERNSYQQAGYFQVISKLLGVQ